MGSSCGCKSRGFPCTALCSCKGDDTECLNPLKIPKLLNGLRHHVYLSHDGGAIGATRVACIHKCLANYGIDAHFDEKGVSQSSVTVMRRADLQKHQGTIISHNAHYWVCKFRVYWTAEHSPEKWPDFFFACHRALVNKKWSRASYSWRSSPRNVRPLLLGNFQPQHIVRPRTV